MKGRAEFQRLHPGVFYLDTTNTRGLQEHLLNLGWIGQNEEIRELEKAGEGNMNVTVRVRTAARSFLLKQSRPWVAKYPQIEASWDRTLVEGRFYELVAGKPELAAKMPCLLGIDAPARLLCLEDLGAAQDFTSMYGGSPVSAAELELLSAFLRGLHEEFRGSIARDVFENRDMRGLNHQHIFVLPLEEGNGLDLDAITPGLQAAARALQGDAEYRRRVREAGELYLADGPALLHGDYFPGSWLRTPSGVKVIDPEFCFFGLPEFDWGVMWAHFLIADQTAELAFGDVDRTLVRRFAGIEIMRRLIGVAQLPLSLDLPAKQRLLDFSRELV